MANKPSIIPKNNKFSTGPTNKPHNWLEKHLNSPLLGRSHLSDDWKDFIKNIKLRTKIILKIPNDYKIIIIPGSASGAIDAMFWNLLGPKDVEIINNGLFSKLWFKNATELMISKEKKVKPVETNISKCNLINDTIFVYNESTTGHSFENEVFFNKENEALWFCDATSSVFCTSIPWKNLDVTVFSCQKGLGSEAGLGVAVLSPNAQKRLKNYIPKRAMPKIFNFRNTNSEFNEDFFSFKISSTPSLLSLLDYNHCLNLYEEYGGITKVKKQCNEKKEMIQKWINDNKKIVTPVIQESKYQSSSVFCFQINKNLLIENNINSNIEHWKIIEQILKTISAAGKDLKGHKLSIPSFRIWTGYTVNKDDIEKLLPWFKWAITEKLTKDNK